ncbi:MAG: subfamily polymerase sigma factor [Candidatus Adlerbacteria bacterium]|nr:subfamily polymerase sigma factor [Candidatus Adlerbacteria bacterium]
MNSHNPTDQELVAHTLRDRHAYRAVVERYTQRLEKYLRRLGADEELAKDILQESFIKAYINLNDYDASLSLSAWLYRIVHNETVSHFRKARIRPEPVRHEKDLALFDTIPDELDIVAEADAQSARAAVQAALDSLESKYRDVLVLRFFEEKSYDEISDILQIPPGTVATYINRGKAKLKSAIRHSKAIDKQ